MPMHHGAGPAQLWGALRGGRKIVLLRRFDPQTALQLVDQHKVTDWNAVPTMMKRLTGLPRAVLERYSVSSIRHLSVGAAPVPYALKEWILGHFGEHCLSEGYGSTETGMVSHLPPHMQRLKPGSSGRPFKHVAVEIRDADGAVLGVNLYGVINCTSACIPGMIERKGGRIITIISDAGRMGDAGLEVYAAAKAGAAGFMRSVARTLGRHRPTAYPSLQPSRPRSRSA